MKRSAVWLLLVSVAVVLCVVGCAKQSPPPETAEGYKPGLAPGESTPAPTPSSPAAPTATPVPEPGKLCVLVPLTGEHGAQGRAFLQGLKLGLASLGAPIGLTDKSVIVKDLSDVADGGVAAAVLALQTEKPLALLGLPDPQAVSKLAPELKKASVPL